MAPKKDPTEAEAPIQDPTEAEAPIQDPTEAFVLCDCCFGKAGEVVNLSADDAKYGVDNGVLDTNQAAIDNAKG